MPNFVFNLSFLLLLLQSGKDIWVPTTPPPPYHFSWSYEHVFHGVAILKLNQGISMKSTSKLICIYFIPLVIIQSGVPFFILLSFSHSQRLIIRSFFLAHFLYKDSNSLEHPS
eukprot:c49429_g1_i1 orf=136-474(-)